ncbi:hypothetical protein OKW24_003186 [Peribacillus simplex]|uniref:hypothetical protein n=1 Tax=Peribacillus simplex TaxID=1478 RepID=UPI0024E26EBC|nr:hypothetical protein [Peribacillus simplex]MDF9761413.1 hypothetical protein [Peribacillus simplex]
MALRASQTGIYYARTLFIMSDEKVRKYNPKKSLKENKKAIAVGYGLLACKILAG